MNSPATRFPSLAANAALADVQVRQTLAMGLLPLGIALLLMAAGAPAWPAPGIWAGTAATLLAMALLWGLWRKSGHRHLRGYSTTHFLVRYLFIVLSPLLLWIVFGEVLLEMAGILPPLMLGLLLLLYPAGRILKERVGTTPLQSPHAEMARIVCQQVEVVLLVFVIFGMLSGAVLDAHRDYPTDPTPLLLFFWLLALLAVLISVVLAAARWHQLFGRRTTPQALDDEPPAPAARHPGRFGSDRF
jgi:hypothetical protein